MINYDLGLYRWQVTIERLFFIAATKKSNDTFEPIVKIVNHTVKRKRILNQFSHSESITQLIARSVQLISFLPIDWMHLRRQSKTGFSFCGHFKPKCSTGIIIVSNFEELVRHCFLSPIEPKIVAQRNWASKKMKTELIRMQKFYILEKTVKNYIFPLTFWNKCCVFCEIYRPTLLCSFSRRKRRKSIRSWHPYPKFFYAFASPYVFCCFCSEFDGQFFFNTCTKLWKDLKKFFHRSTWSSSILCEAGH